MQAVITFDHSLSREEIQDWIDTLKENPAVSDARIQEEGCSGCGGCSDARGGN